MKSVEENKYSVIIIDDESHVREAIKGMITRYAAEFKVIADFSKIADALPALKLEQPDVLLLDIEIGNENGFDLFKYFPKPEFKVIFITAFAQYAIQAFRFSALDYLLKPIDPDLLNEALQKTKLTIGNDRNAIKLRSFVHNMGGIPFPKKRIILKTTESIYTVTISDIVYCEAAGSYTSFYLNDKTRILVSHSIGEYEELLENPSFFRVHQSYLVNLDYVKRFDKNDGGKLILKDGQTVPVATRKKDALLEQLAML